MNAIAVAWPGDTKEADSAAPTYLSHSFRVTLTFSRLWQEIPSSPSSWCKAVSPLSPRNRSSLNLHPASIPVVEPRPQFLLILFLHHDWGSSSLVPSPYFPSPPRLRFPLAVLLGVCAVNVVIARSLSSWYCDFSLFSLLSDLASPLAQKLYKQIDFYFSDSNYPKDKFLRETADANEGCTSLLSIETALFPGIPIATIATFSRMKSMTTDVAMITAVARTLLIWLYIVKLTSSVESAEVNEAGDKIKRKNPLPEKDTVDERSLYIVRIFFLLSRLLTFQERISIHWWCDYWVCGFSISRRRRPLCSFRS